MRNKDEVRNGEFDWGDKKTAVSNDFLSDLLPHYVTPRHRRMNHIKDQDFNDVITGTRKSRSITF